MEVSQKIKIIRIYLFFILIYCNQIISIKGEQYNTYISFLSKITIKINKTGNQKIFSSSFNNYPNKVLVNDKQESISSNTLNLIGSPNIIELFWNDDLSTCEKMFSKCNGIVEVDLSQFSGTRIKKFNYMFEDCISLTSINILNLDTSSATGMSYMFLNCSKIISLDLSNFNTHSVTNMKYMFSGCKSLIYLNVSNFDTSKVISMTEMFHNCGELESLDLSNFYTPSLEYMGFMFAECQSLKYINLNNFNTSKIQEMKRVFYNCKSLISLNLSSFDTSNVYLMVSMFNGCENLISLDISSFNTEKLRNADCMFRNCKSITSLNLSNFFTPELKDTGYMFLNDENLEFLDISNFDVSMVDRLDDMFKNCIKLKYVNMKNTTSLDWMICSGVFADVVEEMIFCVEEFENPDLYHSIIDYVPNSTINCSDDAFIYNSETNNMESCSLNITCLLENITNNEELYNLIINNILKAYSNDEDNIIEGKDNIIFQLTNNKNQLNILNNKTLINNNQNLSIIDLAKCEDILKKEYNINPNDSLIILKQENISTNLKSSEKNIKYEVFEPYNKTKLNLSLCEGTNINLYTKMTLSDKTKRMYERLKALGYDMFNINDKFYQDICTPYKTEDSTDILLTDRIDFIYNNDDAQCQTNCQFSEYLLDTQYISCECSLDGNIQKNRIDKFNAKKIYESFYEVLKYSNYQVFKCYKLVFSKKILENIGGIIIFLYFCINIGCFVFYLIKKDISLKNEILKYNNLNKDNNDIKKSDGIIIDYKKVNEIKNEHKISFPPKKMKKK